MMQSSLVVSSSCNMSRSLHVKSREEKNLVLDDKVARFNRMADSDLMNQDYAAELLLQMHRIATNEVLQLSPLSIKSSTTTMDATVHLISPVQRPKERSIKILLPSSTISADSPLRVSSLATNKKSSTLLQSTTARFRTVSIGGINDILEGNHNDDWMKVVMDNVATCARGSVSPLHLGCARASTPVDDTRPDSGSHSSGFVVTPNAPKKLMRQNHASYPKTHLHSRYQTLVQSISKDSYDGELDMDDNDEEWKADCDAYVKSPSRRVKAGGEEPSPPTCTTSNNKKLGRTPSTPTSHKYVGETVLPNVNVRDVLRKKFSWKSFPELENYLINHRKQYLECSNAMNYTKAQKHYNNELTQGLLQLAATQGYIFEEFTFAAVRDRIRCFYKSFVQATKKKKRVQPRNKYYE